MGLIPPQSHGIYGDALTLSRPNNELSHNSVDFTTELLHY